MEKSVLYHVKSIVSEKHVDEFNEWYHHKHMPKLMERSGCKIARRFKAIESEDKYLYLAVYEFDDIEKYQKYNNSKTKQELVLDFQQTFGGRADEFKRELKRSVWEQIYP